MKQNDVDTVISALKPAMVDELADAAYARRPDASLIRARTGPVSRALVPGRRPVRRLAFATGATAVVAATAMLATGVLSGGHDGGTASNGASGRKGAIDTRTFLLASADTVAKEPTTVGTCWYSRTRMWQDLMPYKPGPGNPIPQGKRQMFQAQTASSSEDWTCTTPGGTGMRFRNRGPLDIKVTFPTKKDEAAWKAAGSPPLSVNGGTTASKPSTITYDKPTNKTYGYKVSHLVNPSIGSHEIEWKTMPTLPTTKSSLETYLRRLWQQDRTGGANGYVAPADFGVYVFQGAGSLFSAPIRPGTRAALYRILADHPSVKVTGRITDRQGRSGVAITARTTDGAIERLVVDPKTARLLDVEYLPGNRPGTPGAHGVSEYRAFERQGWVNTIGAIPNS
ncbi:CU044_5270 family protein [Actinoallomurus rhizosphaericola]|uniref:CU044_5270 family protein n=1 Tax=Actinoallomurus rhizosphaericola TaxID=2952536 RepID=UPI0020901642|nr:CU044_5270 family protein [Actinoallomurus rhizosphaericola]MCO5991867.1 CU044_5270 family protein [Actinoallomurus rhizosphaericola]